MKFEVTNQNNQARTGLVQFTRQNIPPLETPAVISYTKTGYIPHITPNLFWNTSTTRSVPYLVALEHFLDNSNSLSKMPSFMSLLNHRTEDIILCDARDVNSITCESPQHRQIFKSKISTILPADQRSHLTPESFVARIQSLKPDIVIALSDYFADGCQNENNSKKSKVPPSKQHLPVQQVKRNIAFLKDTIKYLQENNISIDLFAVVLGQDDVNARIECSKEIEKLDDQISGYVIPLQSSHPDLITSSLSHLNNEKPRFLLGSLTLKDVVTGIANGIDMVDNSMIYKLTQDRKILNASFMKSTFELIDTKNTDLFERFDTPGKDCECWTCMDKYSLSYIHHLVKKNEMVADMLIMSHNWYTFENFVMEIRNSINDATFPSLYEKFISL